MEVSLDEARIAAENLSRVRLERDLRECVLFYVQSSRLKPVIFTLRSRAPSLLIYSALTLIVV
jgi:hypothetical protein